MEKFPTQWGNKHWGIFNIFKYKSGNTLGCSPDVTKMPISPNLSLCTEARPWCSTHVFQGVKPEIGKDEDKMLRLKMLED